jgi:hypothetical protein
MTLLERFNTDAAALMPARAGAAEIRWRAWPMGYNIYVAVGRDNIDLRDEIDRILERRKPEITAWLPAYHVPRAPE